MRRWRQILRRRRRAARIGRILILIEGEADQLLDSIARTKCTLEGHTLYGVDAIRVVR